MSIPEKISGAEFADYQTFKKEGRTWDLTMRPHQFFLPEFGPVLINQITPAEAVSDLLARIDSEGYDAAYREDIFGKEENQKDRYVNGVLEVFTKLYDMPDASWIKFDIEAGDVCRACAIGAHCRATRYVAREHSTGDQLSNELHKRSDIVEALLATDSKPGVDYFFGPLYERPLLDFSGNKLSFQGEKAVDVVIFSALIANAGALREAYKYIEANR